MSKNLKDEPERKRQGDVKKGTKKLYQLEEVLQLTPGRFESAISEAPALSKFSDQVGKYMGALLNSYGGIVRWGVTRTGLAKVKVIGTHCDRKMEDEFKVAVDCVAKGFSPRIDPSLYRLDFVEILRKTTNKPFREIRVIELRVQAGQELLYMDQEQRVRVVNGSTVYGPLIPQEIKRLVLKKYRKELLDSQSLLDVITPLVSRPLPGPITPLPIRPPMGVSVDTQTSPALCHGNGKNSSTVTPMQSRVNKSKVACLGTPMPTHTTTSKVHSATPMQTHVSKNNACSITPMHAHINNTKMSSPMETPKQNLQSALETSTCTPFVGKESSNSADITEACVDSSDPGTAEPKQNLQTVLETSVCTPSVGKRSSSRAGNTGSVNLLESEDATQESMADIKTGKEILATEDKVTPQAEDKDKAKNTLEDVGTGENTSQGQDVAKDAAKDKEIPLIDLTEDTDVSRRRDSIGTFAHKLLEESLDTKKDPKTESDTKENENPTGKEAGSASSNNKTSLAERVKTFLQDVKQKIRPNSSKEEETCPGKGSKVLKAEGNVKVKVGKKEDESERKRKQPQRPPARNQSQSQSRPRNNPQNTKGYTLTYHSQLFNSYNQQNNQETYNQHGYKEEAYNQQAYNQQSCNQQSYNEQSYNQRTCNQQGYTRQQQSYSHLLQAAFSRNQTQQPYSQRQAARYQMSFVAQQFGNDSQGRHSSNMTDVDSQGRHSSNMTDVDSQGRHSSNMADVDWHDFYRLRQQAAIMDAWRGSSY
ncbi:SLFNL1 [Branchiostoma lanceolatum]|uniref:SLFNL1 protein n=1 Tax=Branchiostoma lanceolatum TaxID=7740 RepID=A0A8K0EE01_BRALA|nr:SLFNL1 [Branchiostoma lanceolatum]